VPGFGLDKLANRIEQTRISEEVRLDVNANAWLWIQEHWLSGSGAGSFGSQFPAYRTADVSPFFDFAHNDIIYRYWANMASSAQRSF
jgi:putative inorganic carbon (HCO3(-)) transporter